MATAVSPPELLSDTLCCARCRGPRQRDDGTCADCGAPWCGVGPVVNFLGDAGFLMPAKNDLSMAAWLQDHRGRWDSLPPGAPLSYEQLADETVSASEIDRMVAGSTFAQIRNDLRQILDGVPTPSVTVQFMQSQTRIGPDSTVLDVGCSSGRHLWELVPRNPRSLTGVDVQLFPLAAGALAWQRRDLPRQPTWCCASILNLPFHDGAFSHVHCFGTLSVVPVQAALAELKRVLAPGGQMMVTLEGMGYWKRNWDAAPVFSRERVNLFRRWLAERLLRCGLDWQQHPLLRRLSGHNQFTRPTIELAIRRAGLVIEECQVLNEYKQRPLLFGLTLRKGDGPAV